MSQFGTIPPGYRLIPWCAVYGYDGPAMGHECVEGVCYPATVPITLPRPLLDSYPMGCEHPRPCTEVVQELCDEHGTGYVVEAGSSPGFTGMPIYWQTLSCGCHQVDDSADDIEAVR